MPTELDTFTLEADGAVYDALTDNPRRILRTTHGGAAVVIAHADDRGAAFELAAREAAEHDDPIYTILLTDAQLAGIDEGHDQHAEALDGHNDHQPAGTIKVYSEAVYGIPSPYGVLFAEHALTDEITTGAVFAGGDCTETGNYVIHRALTDYNPETGAIAVHVLEPGWDDLSDDERAARTNQIETGPDHLVDLLADTDRANLLTKLGVRDIAAPTEPKLPDFTSFTVGAGGSIAAALADHRVLSSMSCNMFFTIANAADRDRALAESDELVDRFEGLRFIYTILLTDEQLTAVADGAELFVDVLNAQNEHRPAPTPIKVNNKVTWGVLTGYGVVDSTVALTSEVHAGDVYTCGADNLGNGLPGFTVYRALADYNPETGRLDHHVVSPDWKPTDYSGGLTDGPDTIVLRVNDPAEFLARPDLAGMPDLPTKA